MNYSHTRLNRRANRGFTLIELLVIIVVIGILAAIIILGYNNVQTRAKNTVRATEVKQYANLFHSYKLAKINPNGDGWPNVSPGTYCLGTGFPQSPSSPSLRTCRDWQQPTSPTNTSLTPNETSSKPLMDELQKAGKVAIANDSHNDTSVPTIGPYVQVHSNRIVITAILIGKTQDVCDEFEVKLDTTNPDDMGWDGFAATGKPIQSCGVIIER